MTRDIKLYFEDILKAIEEIENFLDNRSFDDFSMDTKTIRAVTMNFIIIGEAARNVPSKYRKRYHQIPWSKVVGMRNILTHDYPETNVEIVWKTVEKTLATPKIGDSRNTKRKKVKSLVPIVGLEEA